jgi:hypothetical protein
MAMRRSKGRRTGRPRKANARRRATTTAGRRPPIDSGSPELVYRKTRVANGSAATVELPHHLIEDAELVAVRLIADLLAQFRRAFGTRLANPSGLWAAITSGTGLGSIAMPSPTSGGSRALMRLTELHQHFADLGMLERLALIIRVALAEGPPADAHELAELRAGLHAFLALQRRGRGPRHQPPRDPPGAIPG